MPNMQDSPPEPPPFAFWRRAWARLDLREGFWFLLDCWEEHAGLRRGVYAALALALLLGGAAAWYYPRWAYYRAERIAAQWLAAGRADRAEEAVGRLITLAPESVSTWQAVEELARLRNDATAVLRAAQRAAELAPDRLDLALALCGATLSAGDEATTARRLGALPPDFVSTSDYALRLRGELARRSGRWTEAVDYFSQAQKLGGEIAVNEIPLGLVSLRTGTEIDRQRALVLLAKWVGDPEWGVEALRPLLGEALRADDKPALRRWADALLTHPRASTTDVPVVLNALFRSDETRYRAVLASLQRDYIGEPMRASLLLGWLVQIGRAEDALGWATTLPEFVTRRPPGVVNLAEARRLTGRWADLAAWTAEGPWSDDVEFLRSLYAWEAALQLGDIEAAAKGRSALEAQTRVRTTSALFAANTLYVWGRIEPALALWETAAQQPETAWLALGALVRHAQIKDDAPGQYAIFRRLHALRPDDPDVANNLAYFSALTGLDRLGAVRLARETLHKNPGRVAYQITAALAEVRRGEPALALALLEPLAERVKSAGESAPGFEITYALALAEAGKTAEARPRLAKLQAAENGLTRLETQLVKEALERIKP
ncbi:MAG: hypothetical protein RL376_1867 [Verrucomicrobiota bacterium]